MSSWKAVEYLTIILKVNICVSVAVTVGLFDTDFELLRNVRRSKRFSEMCGLYLMTVWHLAFISLRWPPY